MVLLYKIKKAVKRNAAFTFELFSVNLYIVT